MSASEASDVIIIGGGAIGCACAYELAKRGVSVLLLERSSPGAGASSAAAGILAAQADALGDGPAFRLALASRSRFPALVTELGERTGMDVGFRLSGVTEIATTAAELEDLERRTAWQASAGLPVEALDATGARRVEPAIADAVGGAHFAEEARIDPPLLVAALRIAAERAGARVLSGAHVRKIVVTGDRATGVLLEDGTSMVAANVVVAAGSWSGLVEGTGLPADAVRPVRGQIVELTVSQPLLSGIVYGPRCYLSPRDDGRVLVGSTLEFVGFRPGVTASAVRDLLGAALGLAPALEAAAFVRAWSGFRPHTRDELPLLGPTSVKGLLLATGHYRSGILLAPITAEIIAAFVVGSDLPIDVEPFSPQRVATAPDAAMGSEPVVRPTDGPPK
jgi:glycine oxidase